jgi:hypothetical protein
MLFLQLPGGFLGAIEIERVDFLDHAEGFGRHGELRGVNRARRKRKKKKTS